MVIGIGVPKLDDMVNLHGGLKQMAAYMCFRFVFCALVKATRGPSSLKKV